MKTKEEILGQNGFGQSYYEGNKQSLFDAMQEYAEAYHQEQSVLVTDEGIEAHAHNVFAISNLLSTPDLPVEISKLIESIYCDGAKWFRDQLKPVDLREELVKFVTEYKKTNEYLMIVNPEDDVDDYLKTR